MNIIKNHPLRFSIAASASVPWIYMAQFWHTLKEDGSKHRLKFLLDRKELTLTLDDFRTIFHLPQENDNNHASFIYGLLQTALEDVMHDIRPRHDDTSIPDTRLELKSDKESPKVEIVQEKEEETTKDTKVEPDKDTPMVDVTNIVPPINVDDEEDEITEEVSELRRRVKGKNVEETRISPIPSPTRSPRNLSTLVSSDIEKLQELMVTHPTPSSGSSEPKLTKTNRLLSLIKAKPNRSTPETEKARAHSHLHIRQTKSITTLPTKLHSANLTIDESLYFRDTTQSTTPHSESWIYGEYGMTIKSSGVGERSWSGDLSYIVIEEKFRGCKGLIWEEFDLRSDRRKVWKELWEEFDGVWVGEEERDDGCDWKYGDEDDLV
ncbi:hypothetical protein Tco_0494647 [Tanacetum coccineum]